MCNYIYRSTLNQYVLADESVDSLKKKTQERDRNEIGTTADELK